MFAGSAFFVARIEGETTKTDCLKGSSQWLVSSTRKLRVNKTSFARFEIGDAWAGGAQTDYVYRTFHRGVCYELGITGTERHDGLDSDTTQEFTREDQEEVDRTLDEPLRSFRFSR
jgi:hypothetical protein